MAKPRVIITTDIGGDDKDDAQSFIHALLYADEVNYRGFVSTMTDDRNGNPDYHFNRIIDAYGRDLSKLRETGDYPSASEMRSLIHKGSVNPDFPGALSSGARHIIDEARAASPNDPVYLLAWGPVHDIAAALKAAPDIVDSVRVYSVYGLGQDRVNTEAYKWMKDAVGDDSRYSDLFWINAEESFRGMYAGSSGQNDPGRNLGWVKDNVDGHGALGNLFHDVYSYDLYGNGGSAKGLKMGDTPSLLYVLDNVDNDNPGARSWGGSFAKNGWGDNTWDDRDGSGDRLGSYDGARTVYENRSEAWGDFADRLDRAKDGSGRKDNDSVDLGESPTGGVPNGSEEVMVTTGRTQAEAFDLAGGYVYEGRSASAGGANI
ncbi:nucleoside hydrolase-like domain-containing protein, partial [uncultured Jannaschia sp.]|uniref:nucleoside hydrolase-like domain-containing protein n=1 Tax=uncultured Jannaschia sp. TaxID=293347 RepID=UPI002633DBEA